MSELPHNKFCKCGRHGPGSFRAAQELLAQARTHPHDPDFCIDPIHDAEYVDVDPSRDTEIERIAVLLTTAGVDPATDICTMDDHHGEPFAAALYDAGLRSQPATTWAAPTSAPSLDVEGAVAEMIGVESAIEDALHRAKQVTAVLAGLARLSQPADNEAAE